MTGYRYSHFARTGHVVDPTPDGYKREAAFLRRAANDYLNFADRHDDQPARDAAARLTDRTVMFERMANERRN